MIIPERLRPAHWEGFRNAIGSGLTKYEGRSLTTRSVHKDGTKLYVDLSFSLVRGPSGAVAGALAIGRDATSRYLAENAQRERVAALEKQCAALATGAARQ